MEYSPVPSPRSDSKEKFRADLRCKFSILQGVGFVSSIDVHDASLEELQDEYKNLVSEFKAQESEESRKVRLNVCCLLIELCGVRILGRSEMSGITNKLLNSNLTTIQKMMICDEYIAELKNSGNSQIEEYFKLIIDHFNGNKMLSIELLEKFKSNEQEEIFYINQWIK